VPDPVQEGLITSLAQPGENITGFATTSSLLTSKRFGLLNETIPKLSRIAVLWDPTNPSSELAWKESQLAAKELRLQLFSLAVSNADKYESGFKEASKAHVAALAVTLHGLANSNQKKITDLAATYHLPAIYPRRDHVETGGLMSYAADQREPYQRAAVYVDKILKGTKPADLPVEQPKKFVLVINLKTAKQIGLTIPPNVLARADKVIR
jgi:putative ABC transport system substrate-binding protein